MILNKLDFNEYTSNNQILQKSIEKNGFTFEGKEFPYSIVPIVLNRSEEAYIKESTEVLIESLELALNAYQSDEYVRNFFSYYDKYKDILNINQTGKHIAISRFDTVWYGKNDYKVFECNTCCPGGISILGSIKREYVKLPYITENLDMNKYIPFDCDYTNSFITALINQYENSTEYRPSKVGIAFANYKGFYSYELKEFAEEANALGFNAVVCDLSELYLTEDSKLYYKDMEINIVYNKVDQLMLTTELVAPVAKAIKSKHAISANSYKSMYITESKMILALLQDSEFQNKYLSDRQISFIDKHIPWTRKLEDISTMFKGEKINLIEYISKYKDSFVIKIDNSTRGDRIFIGKNCDQDTWLELIKCNINENWIVQEYCEIPKITVPVAENSELKFVDKNYGLDFFMFNGRYSGIVSRVSESSIINVGAGGSEQPVLVFDN